MDLAQKPVYKLDLAAGTSVVNLTTPLVEGDDRAQTFTLELTDKGAPANLNGYSVTAYFGRGKTAEAEADTIPVSGTVSGNVATITLTESCYSRSCYFSMPIRLSNGATGQKRTYLIVRGTVVKSVDGTIIDPDGSVPSLDDLFAQIAVMERSRQAAEEATKEALAAAARADKARESIQDDLAALSEEIDRNTAPAIIPTATGSIVTITDGAARPAVEVISHIEPVQSGSGEASPNNKRPISGWNSLNAWRTGANLAYNEAISSSIGGLTFSVSDDGTITVDGTANETVFYHVGAVTLKPGSYRMSGAPFGGSAGTYYMYFDTYYGDRVIDNGAGVTFGVSAEMTIALTIRVSQGATVSKLIFHPGITREDYEGSYEPYQGHTLSATLPETVYGGKLDWTTGVLTVTHKIVDLSTLVWHYDSSVGGFFTTYLAGEIGSNNKGFLVCSAYTAGDEGNWWTTNNSVSFNWDGRVLIRDTRFSDAADFVAALSGVMLVYPISAHRTIQLTPYQLSTLYGINNVWSDCGDTTISYVADTQRYIDNKLAAIAAATL